MLLRNAHHRTLYGGDRQRCQYTKFAVKHTELPKPLRTSQMQLNMFGRCKSTHSAGNQQRHVCCAAGNANNSSSEPSQAPQQASQQQQPPAPASAAVPPSPSMLHPALAAKALLAAGLSGRKASDITPQDTALIAAAWLPLLPKTLAECNKLLSTRMKAALTGDPVAFDLMKQDGREFMTGAISAAEFSDRFFGIFAAVPAQLADELFIQMAFIVPQSNRRLELLRLARNPWVLPSGPLNSAPVTQTVAPPASTPASAAAVQPNNQATTKAAQTQQTQQHAEPHEAVQGEDEGEYEVEDEDEDEDEQVETFGFDDDGQDEQDGVEDEGEGHDEAEFGAGDDVDGRQQTGEPDLLAPGDLRELKGWQELDRSRLQQLASTVAVPSSAQLTAAAAAKRPASQKNALDGLRFMGGVEDDTIDSRPAKKKAGKKTKAADDSSSCSNPNAIMWFRQDLRVHDNPALTEAAKWAARHGGYVTFVYIHSPQEDGDSFSDPGCSWRPGAASLLWAQQALKSLSTDLVSRYGAGAAILHKQGPYAAALQEVATATNAGAVFYNRRYEPAMAATDVALSEVLRSQGLMVQSYSSYLLQEPWDVKLDMSKWCGHFGTLTPFYRSWTALRQPTPLPEPKNVPVAGKEQAAQTAALGMPLQQLGLYNPPRRRKLQQAPTQQVDCLQQPLHNPQQQQQQQQSAVDIPFNSHTNSQQAAAANATDVIDWGASIRDGWDISERGALQQLAHFLSSSDGLAAYEAARSYADGRSVSRLSPYLHWGQLSPRLMWQKMKTARAQSVSKTFHRRLVWRELAYWQLYYWPNMAREPIRTLYRDMQWRNGPEAARLLTAWKKGQTGFPLVDAGMRELWQTGWMQQSIRMVAAAFLTEYLNLPWSEGAAWFHDTLVDADLAINSMMWQNAGKSGLDQWNFTMLPTSKSQDPTGAYIRRWVPELSQLPTAHIHTPWTAPEATLRSAGVELGETYPHRIVCDDLAELRAANVKAIRAARSAAVQAGLADGRGYDMLVVPEGCTTKHDGKKMVIFTKQEYRQLDAPITSTGRSMVAAVDGSSMVDEGEADDLDQMAVPALTKSAKRRQKQQASGSSRSSSKGVAKKGAKSGRTTFKDMQQQTLEGYLAKSGSLL